MGRLSRNRDFFTKHVENTVVHFKCIHSEIKNTYNITDKSNTLHTPDITENMLDYQNMLKTLQKKTASYKELKNDQENLERDIEHLNKDNEKLQNQLDLAQDNTKLLTDKTNIIDEFSKKVANISTLKSCTE